MSGIFIDGMGFCENTDKICTRCKSPVWETNTTDYSFQCLSCDEDLYDFETETQDPHHLPKVVVGRHIHGITLNNELEYLLDENGNERIFDSQPVAEAFLLANGFELEDLEFMYFVEVANET